MVILCAPLENFSSFKFTCSLSEFVEKRASCVLPVQVASFRLDILLGLAMVGKSRLVFYLPC